MGVDLSSYFRGKRFVITGSSGHLGSMLTIALIELHAHVIGVDKLLVPDHLFLKSLGDGQKRFEYIACDLTCSDSRQKCIHKICSTFPSLNGLVNLAGFAGLSATNGWIGPFETQTTHVFRSALEVNLVAPFELIRELMPLLREARGDASIVNVSSIYGSLAPDPGLYLDTEMGNPAGYGASKAGLEQLSKWLAAVLAPDIRVNAIAPGGIYRGQPNNFVKRYEKRTPFQRMGSEDDFLGSFLFLLNPELSGYTTGQVLMVDGGFSVW